MWDLNQRSRSLILTGVTFCHWNFLFSCSKVSDANTGIITNVMCLWNTRMNTHICKISGLANRKVSLTKYPCYRVKFIMDPIGWFLNSLISLSRGPYREIRVKHGLFGYCGYLWLRICGEHGLLCCRGYLRLLITDLLETRIVVWLQISVITDLWENQLNLDWIVSVTWSSICASREVSSWFKCWGPFTLSYCECESYLSNNY